MLPFYFMGWVECIAYTAYDWLFTTILNNVHVEEKGDFSVLSQVTHTGAMLIGTYDNFAGGDLITQHKRLTNTVHKYDCPVIVQLADNVDIPVILVGGHRSIGNMEMILNESKIEFLSLSRPLVREPDLPNRWHSSDTTPAKCISCNMCYRTPGHGCVFNR